MAREIKITIDDHGALDVWEGDSHTENLCFGEMLETITDLCHPKLPGVARYAMLTADEWRARYPKTRGEDEPATPAPWPRTVTAYVHGDRVGMYNIGKEIGLDGEAADLFSYALCEVRCTIAVNADGTYTTLEMKG